jgi:hypothetical protein
LTGLQDFQDLHDFRSLRFDYYLNGLLPDIRMFASQPNQSGSFTRFDPNRADTTKQRERILTNDLPWTSDTKTNRGVS